MEGVHTTDLSPRSHEGVTGDVVNWEESWGGDSKMLRSVCTCWCADSSLYGTAPSEPRSTTAAPRGSLTLNHGEGREVLQAFVASKFLEICIGNNCLDQVVWPRQSATVEHFRVERQLIACDVRRLADFSEKLSDVERCVCWSSLAEALR